MAGAGVPASDAAGVAETLRQARSAAAAARFDVAVRLATPLFHDARDTAQWSLAAEAALVLARAAVGLKRPDDSLRWAHEALQSAQSGGSAEADARPGWRWQASMRARSGRERHSRRWTRFCASCRRWDRRLRSKQR